MRAHAEPDEVARVLAERYAARAQPLKARSALVALRVATEALDSQHVAGAADILLAIDRLEASSSDLEASRQSPRSSLSRNSMS